MADHLTVFVPAGMGDFSWIYSKLTCLGKRLKVLVVSEGLQRAVQMKSVLPMVESMEPGRLSYPQLRVLAQPSNTPRSFFENHDPDDPIVLSANDHIMDQPGAPARRIETWMPELETDHHYEVDVPDDPQVTEWLSGVGKYICIYGANDVGIAAWRGWQHTEWFQFMQLVRSRLPDVAFVMIGASWDKGLSDRLIPLCAAQGIPLVSTVTKTTLAQALDIIKRSIYMVAFPSGLPIMAAAMRKPVFMFYPAGGMMSMAYTWVDPKMIEDKSYIGSEFVAPSVVWTRMIDEYKLANKMGKDWGSNVKDRPIKDSISPAACVGRKLVTSATLPRAFTTAAGSSGSKLRRRRDGIRARRARKGLKVR